MKPRLALAISVAFTALCSGCHNFPRDGYVQGMKSTVNTPWGPSTIEADILATGSAARNISLPEMPAPATKKK